MIEFQTLSASSERPERNVLCLNPAYTHDPRLRIRASNAYKWVRIFDHITLVEWGLLSLIRLFCNPRFARLTFRYANQAYPERSANLRRARFYFRSFISFRPSLSWFNLLDSHPDLRDCVRHEPEMAEKLHRPYRRTDLSVARRLQLIVEHVRISDEIGFSGLMARAYREPVEIALFNNRTGQPLSLLLGRPGQFGKEGELALHLSDGINRIYSACFSLRELNGLRELDIGCLQGPAGDMDGRQLIRELTRNLHGLRPRSLILESLRSIAQSLDCDRLRVVGNANHIYRSWRKRRNIAFDYDEFCSEIDSHQLVGHDWLLSNSKEPI